MVARLLAFVAAVAMVAGALVVRDRIDGGDDGGGGGRGRALRLVCSTELASTCESLAARTEGLQTEVEPAGTTAARLSSDTAAHVDGWLVPMPWPEIVRSARQRGGLAETVRVGPVLARSPVVLAVWPDRQEALRRHCPGGQIGWRCVGDAAGQPWPAVGGQAGWGMVKPGHGDPTLDGSGLVVLGGAATGFFASAAFSRADIEDNDGFRSWLTRLERAVRSFRQSTGTPLRDMLVKGPAAFDVVGTTEAEARPLLATAARSDPPVLLYPAPMATADVVLASLPGDGARRLADTLGSAAARQALGAAGWRVAGSDAGTTSPPLPRQSGLPASGVMEALTQAWREVTG